MKKNIFSLLLFFLSFLQADQDKIGLGKTHFILGQPKQVQAEQLRNPERNSASASKVKLKAQEIFFSPEDNLSGKLVAYIDKEKEAVRVAIYMITKDEIAKALARAKQRGVLVELVTDVGCLKDRASKIQDLQASGCAVYIYNPTSSAKGSSLMHHKFALFSKNQEGPLVWTGSFNFTNAADKSNQENVIVLQDKKAFEKFSEQFGKLKERSYRYSKSALVI